MKTLACLVFGLLILISTKAQDISQIEYFFDNDPGFGNGIPVSFTPDSLVTASFTANITGVPTGLHILCIRARNELNLWSILSWRLFAVFDYLTIQDIVQMEYYVDNDPGYGNGRQVSVSAGSLVTSLFTIDLTGVAPGIHLLVARCKNALNQWSQVGHYSFLSAAPGFENIAGLEYYIDNDPGYGKGIPVTITPGKNVTQGFIIDLTGVSPGIHKLITRCKNSADQWSQIGHYPFISVNPVIGDILQIEYFVDTDPGFGKAIPLSITPGNTVTKVFTPDLSGLSDGIHLLCLRSRNIYNCWSSLEKTILLNQDVALHMITKLEYYFTNDPGFGKGKDVSVTPALQLTSNFILDTNDISAGSYYLVTRVMNDAARWSIIASERITIKTKIWTGTIDDDWKVADNWEPAGVPVSTDKVMIPAGTTWMPVVRESGHRCHDISVADGATLTLLPGIALEITGDMRIE
jgi:hypothetical protein